MIKGIDVSHHQTEHEAIDWMRVRKSDVGYAIIKATEGVNYTDPAFHANIRGAIAAGLPVGAYHFLRATPIDQQCKDFLAAIKPYKPALLAIDVENPYKDGKVIPEISNLGKAAITDRIITIYKAIRAAGYTCPVYVYSSKSWLGTYIDADRCKSAGMRIWLAWYSNAMPDNTDRSGLCDMWQYCSDGNVDGISGKVDCNVSYRNFGTPQTAVKIDTTIDIKKPAGDVYTFKVTCDKTPAVSIGNSKVAALFFCRRDGNNYFYHLFFCGKPGEETGIYTVAQGEDKLIRFKAKVK